MGIEIKRSRTRQVKPRKKRAREQNLMFKRVLLASLLPLVMTPQITTIAMEITLQKPKRHPSNSKPVGAVRRVMKRRR
jgi:hypothetical protein